MTELPKELLSLSPEKRVEAMCRAHPGVWAERKRGFVNSPAHWEWYRAMMQAKRLAMIAPRDHAKTEILTVNATAHRSIYIPGIWTYIFAATGDQAKELKSRIDGAINETNPGLVRMATVDTKSESVYANGSRVTVAGAGKAVRGAHPDVIVGDDVLEEESTSSSLQRKKIERWWLGTVSGMVHPGREKVVDGKRFSYPATRVFLVGTPFHKQDLLMSMRTNSLYEFRRYQAEFDMADLVPGTWAVEVVSG